VHERGAHVKWLLEVEQATPRKGADVGHPNPHLEARRVLLGVEAVVDAVEDD
jgi:hypothetical protein